jgi:PAS domain S-box-containing protein
MEYLHDHDNNIIGGIESFIDISRQRSLEQSLRNEAAALESRVEERTRELQKSEARFSMVLDNMDDMAYIATEDYRLTFMNQAMRDVFGDRVGDFCYEVLHKVAAPCAWCPMDKVFKNRTLRDERYFGEHSRLYEVVHSPLPEENGLKQKLAVCRDITERDKAEKDLQQANRELDAFVHSVSHDLRGILSPVVTYMDFLRLTYADVLDKQILQILTETERQSERAIALLDDLLDLARVSHIAPARHPTDPAMVVAEVLRELELEDEDHPEITVDKLPATWLPEPLVYQIFSNLIGNACRYAPVESGPVKVGSWDEAGQVIYFVQDHGPGVPLMEREKIFDIFFRGKAARDNRGTGVGLAIVRKIAGRCNGRVWVEQTPGGGATFCVAIPKLPAFGESAVEKP